MESRVERPRAATHRRDVTSSEYAPVEKQPPLLRPLNSEIRVAVRHALPRRAAGPTLALLGAGLGLWSTAAGADGLDEIVVTATRRDSSLQDVPYSISAISAQSLEDNHVNSLADLTRQIAGVSFVDAGPTSRSNIVLRGINANGTDHPSVNTIPPVSTYIGETPLFIPMQIDDLERVEVLRGPQGTLYGSGSLAGTLRFIPKKPDFGGVHADLEGDVSQLAVGHDFNGGLTGMLNLPFGDTVAARFSAGYTHYAGFIDERFIVKLGPPGTAVNSPVGVPVSADPNNPLGPLVFSPIDNANTSNLSHVRAELLWKPADLLSAQLTYYHQNDDANGAQAHSPNFGGNVDTPPAQNPFYSPTYPVSFPTGDTVFPQNSNYDANNSFLLRTNRHTDLGALDVAYELGFGSLSSSTSYYRDAGTDVQDNTGLLTLYPSFYGFLPRMVDYQTDSDATKGFVQEFRLVSKPGPNVDYVAGLFYQKLASDSGQLQWIPGQTQFGTLVGDPGGNAATLGDVNVIASTHSDFKDMAAFGELTLHATDRWQVTGGIRQFKQDYTLFTSTAFPFCGIFCSNTNDALGTTATNRGYSVSNHIFKLNTSYKVSDTLNAYANYAEGFRRGGSNGVPISGPFAANPALLVYTPDKTKNYEVGAKGSVGGVHYSAAVFYIDWNNFQVDATAVASAASIAVNGPKARSKGVEFEVNGEITTGLSYDLGYSYADAQVAQDFTVIDFNTAKQPVSIVTGRAGDPLPNAPKTSVTAALDYRHAAPVVLPDWDVHWHVNGNYRSSTLSQLVSTDPNAPPPFEIHGFAIWDASVALQNHKGLTTTVYVQNITNNLGVTGGVDAGAAGPRGAHFFIGRPRTVGLRVGYSF